MQNAHIVVGVVGGSEGSRHVANVIVGGWYGERRSSLRHVRVLPPRDTIVIWGAGVREAGMSQMSLLVVDSSSFLVHGDWFLVFSFRKNTE